MNKAYAADVQKGEDEIIVTIGDRRFKVRELTMHENAISFRIKNKNYRMPFARDKKKIYISLEGEYYTLELSSGARYGSEGPGQRKDNVIASSMPGLLVKLPVKIGSKVKPGDTVAIVEAMKMQNELRSPVDGIVKSVNFKEGEQVDAFVSIVEIDESP
ncbi:MAG: biotin/lipoyl-binding protein [candidate division WOR-3 bacterium]|nr:MAG: biotin/lipoyl-binding protein [candidate division WOR-3 bacterium]